MSKDPEFLILKPQSGWLPKSDWERILGTSVRNHLDPIRDYAPDNVQQYRRATAKLSETKFEKFILQTEVSSSGSFQLEVKGLGTLRWQKSAGTHLDLRGKVIYMKRLQQQGNYWRSIMKSQDFREKTAEWINEAKRQDKWWSRGQRPVCMIVGVLLCEDVDVCADTSEEQKRVAEGEVRLGTVAAMLAGTHGIPLDTGGVGNASAKSSSANVGRAYFRAKGKETYVCGVELRTIRVQKNSEDKVHALELTDNAPKAERGRALGPEDEDVDPDSLPLQVNLEMLGCDDWEVLLHEMPEYSKEAV